MTKPLFKLTAYRLADADEVYQLIISNPEITKWTLVPEPYSYDDAVWFVSRASIDRTVDADKPRVDFTWAIRDSETDALIGTIAIHPKRCGKGMNMQSDNPEYQAQLVDVMPVGEYFMGYYLAEAYHGRGIMTGAVKAVTDRVLNGIVDNTVFDAERDHVDEIVRLPRINVEHYEENTGSSRVQLKCGFVPQGKHSVRIWRHTGKPTKLPWLVKTADADSKSV